MMQEDCAPRLQQILVHEAHDRHIILRAVRRADNRMLVVDDLVHGADLHRRAAEVVDFGPVLLVLILRRTLRLEPFLVRNELLLHEEVVLDALQLEQLEAAAGGRVHRGELGGGGRAFLLLAANTGGYWGLPFLLLSLLVLVLLVPVFGLLREARWRITLHRR